MIVEVEDPVSKLHLLSFSGVREHLAQPLALESAVEHQLLGYSGIVDCVARSVLKKNSSAYRMPSFPWLSGTKTNWC